MEWIKSGLNGANLVKAVNAWVVSLVLYSTDFVDWSKFELANLDRRTKKGFDMNGRLHPREGEARLYLLRKEDGGDLISVESYVELARVDIGFYVENSEEILLKAVSVTVGNSFTVKARCSWKPGKEGYLTSKGRFRLMDFQRW